MSSVESTVRSSFETSTHFVNNHQEELQKIEIKTINHQIKKIFDTSITDYWIPAEGFLEKCCLFVKVERQEELMNQYEDFEFELYMKLEQQLDHSQFFEMIALM